ncbi:RING finger domain protein [Moelleriella libera RCEF 2490]|uniref:RING-type E3 ubiquitin transferase n=1 Tax=Moelleriella libera RCEF 2490 TaxID=1081109 RepID=A0A167ZAR8_9HYPO|nr:RING finger domain protein [Moelleriella libera RCEF 2490]
MPGWSQDGDDIQSRVLQGTLGEVAAHDKDAAIDCCVICLDVISEPCQALPCGHHNFDYVCLINWLFEHPQCPLCKATVAKVLHGPIHARLTTVFGEQKQANTHSVASRAVQQPARFYGEDRRHINSCRRRSRERHRAVPSISDAVAFRRDVYRHQRYSKHVGSNRLSRYRDLSPSLFCADAELVSRARMWTRRELRVFSFLSPDEESSEGDAARVRTQSSRTAVQRRRASNAEFLLEYVIAILKSVDIMGSGGQAEEMLSDFLGRENTKLFLHELHAWLRSPFTKLEDWDRAVQYEKSPRPRAEAPMSPRPAFGESSRRLDQGNWREARGKGDFYRPRQDHEGRCRRREPRRRAEARDRSMSPRRAHWDATSESH